MNNPTEHEPQPQEGLIVITNELVDAVFKEVSEGDFEETKATERAWMQDNAPVMAGWRDTVFRRIMTFYPPEFDEDGEPKTEPAYQMLAGFLLTNRLLRQASPTGKLPMIADVDLDLMYKNRNDKRAMRLPRRVPGLDRTEASFRKAYEGNAPLVHLMDVQLTNPFTQYGAQICLAPYHRYIAV